MSHEAIRVDLARIGWIIPEGQSIGREVLMGGVPGATLGVLYILVISPAMTQIQETVGDYVPPGKFHRFVHYSTQQSGTLSQLT